MLDFLEALHWGAIFQIIIIDILLGGDNAVVIALACRELPHKQRMQGILWGTAGAIALRITLIAFALSLLDIPFLKAVGGLLLLWIGIKLLVPHDETHTISSSSSLWKAIRTIIVADFAMSLDNIIAIAGAAQNTHVDHQLLYVIFGLLVSVPIIVWGSTLVLKLIDRFAFIVTLGAALLGWIAGTMLAADAGIARWLGSPTPLAVKVAGAAGALLVVSAGKLLAARAQRMQGA